jgi:hypothetical protein
MKPKTLLILALVVGALAAAVLLFERDLPSTDERAARGKKVVPVEAAEMTALDIEWNGGTVRFERDPESAADPAPTADGAAVPAAPERRWRMLEPFTAAADSGAVDGLVSELTAIEVNRDLDGAVRAEVGLEPPRGKVAWRTPKASGVLEIGGSVPAGREVVVASSTRAAPAVIADGVVARLEKAPGEWRSREAFTVARADIDRLTLTSPGAPPVVLAKSGETLALASPIADVADREAVDQLLGDLTGLRIETFLDPPLTENSSAALAAPAGTIEIVAKGAAEPLRIELGGGEPLPGKRVVRAGGQAFVTTTRLLDAVTRAAEAWRSRNWTRFENWRIERVTIDDALGRLVLERKDGKWLRDGVEVPFNVASDLLYALTSARAEALREGASAGDKPLVTIQLADSGGVEEVLTLHAVEGEQQAARVSGRDVTLLLPVAVADDVTRRLGALRAAEPVAAAKPAPAESSAPAPPAGSGS